MIEITAPCRAHFDTLALNFEAFSCTTLIVTQTQKQKENKINLHLLNRNQGLKEDHDRKSRCIRTRYTEKIINKLNNPTGRRRRRRWRKKERGLKEDYK